jgi:2-C-methyl-D-erythritol 4-phosphate cytidylyltransferase
LLPVRWPATDNSGLLFFAYDMSRCVALIPAAGTGSRFGFDRPKQYLPLAQEPMLAWAIRCLALHPAIERVFVVLAAADSWFDRFDWSSAAPALGVKRVGGQTRAHSVLNGLNALEGEVGADEWVLVHDAARPCLSNDLLDRLIAAVRDDPVGGLLAMRVADTLKRGDSQSRIVSTELRDGLWQAQTPQMFRRGLLQRALGRVDPRTATDEACAIEALGLKPLLVESSAQNLKVTYPEDLRLAEAILKAR